MVEEIRNYLNLYITENQIPLKQVLTETDLHQLSVTLSHISKSQANIDFDNISHVIFNGLESKGEAAIKNKIAAIPFEMTTTQEETIANIALLGYYCFMYFRVLHDLPVEKIFLEVNHYMNQHIIKQQDTNKVDCSNPVSNLISINDTEYVRFNGKTIIPPYDSNKLEFITNLTSLLIK